MRASDPTSKRVTRPPDAFDFGRNWQRYIKNYLEPERIAIAAESLRNLVRESLEGKVFVDVGAGSGLFSLCAYQAGAAHVISIDVDPDSVIACRGLQSSVGAPANWVVHEGSILDLEWVAQLPKGDVVYSWGVLHHTGDMHAALRNAADLVKPGGLFCIAIYNRVEGRFLDSRRWLRIKRRYNNSSRVTQRAMEIAYLVYRMLRQLVALRNPWRVAAEYKSSRGMALMTDVSDWLGGYPYEYATVEEIVSFCTAECGMEQLRVLPTPVGGTGNNEFVFRRAG